MSCDICAYAREHGSWPQHMLNKNQTHCDGCHRSWGGYSRAHCAVCHELFTSDGLATRHRRGDSCLTRSEMLQMRDSKNRLVFRLVDTKFGPMWQHPAKLKLEPAFLHE